MDYLTVVFPILEYFKTVNRFASLVSSWHGAFLDVYRKSERELLGLFCSQAFLSSSSFFLLTNRIILGLAKRSSSPPNISTSPLFPLNAQNRLSSERKGQRKSNKIMQRFQNIFNGFSASVHTILFDFQPGFFSGNFLDLTV